MNTIDHVKYPLAERLNAIEEAIAGFEFELEYFQADNEAQSRYVNARLGRILRRIRTAQDQVMP